MRLAIVSTLILLCAAMIGCDDDSTDPGPLKPTWIRGQVKQDQTPLANVAVMMTYQVPGWALPGAKPATPIEFEIPVPATVQLWVEDPCRDELVRTLVEGEMPAGETTIDWDGRDDIGRQVVEGLYQYRLVADTNGVVVAEDTIEVFVALGEYPAVASPDTFEFHTRTNAQGFFEFSQDCLSLGEQVPLPNLAGDVVQYRLSREVRIWAIQEGFLTASTDWVPVGRETGANVSLQMEPDPGR